MPTRRGWAAVAAGLSLWIAARFIGSPDLHVLAVGIVVLPVVATLYVRWTRVRLGIRRHLAPARVYAGSRATVEVTVENLGRTTTSFLLMEDAIPAGLGKPARLVVSGIPPRNQQSATYTIACRRRGRYRVGPLTIFVSDPFGLARTRMNTAGASDLIVYPEVEDLDSGHLVSQGVGAGESAVRHLYRSAAEFYTMREYVTGDDLRRIHWPSVARSGQLMIRQDESTRRSSATVFLDNRAEVLGRAGSPTFERAVSIAASVGRGLIRAGFSLRLATADGPATLVTEERLLEALAGVAPSAVRGTSRVLRGLRSGSLADTTLAVVTAPPVGGDVATISRAGLGFGRKVAVFVQPITTGTASAEALAELSSRASAARVSLQRAGWEVHLVQPEGKLAETWQPRRAKKLQAAASSS
ncbi:MAG TPA: DUF58 domain-containing protein [Actinomycetota bacterium]